MSSDKKLHFGWLVVVACFFIMFGAFTIINTLHSLFLRPVTSDLGVSIKSFSLVFAIGGVGVAVGSSFMGRLLARGNMKLIMSASVIIAGLGFMAYSLVDSIVWFYLIAVIVGISTAGFANIPISIMITNWFHEKKGIAMSIAFTGTGVGAAILSPLLSGILQSYGWRTAYVLSGISVIVISLPFILLFASKSPEEKGITAYGAEDGVEESPAENKISGAPAVGSGLTLKEVKSTSMFWLFIIGMSCIALVAGGVQMHIPSYLQSVGHSVTFAGTIVSVLSLANMAGKLILGPVLDKFGTFGGAVYTGVLMTVALGSLLAAQTSTLAFVFAIAYGLSIVIASVGPTFITADIFGRKDFGAIFGFMQVFFVAGSSVGVILSGFIYDATQSYAFAWLFFLALFIVGMACILISNRLKKSFIAHSRKPAV